MNDLEQLCEALASKGFYAQLLRFPGDDDSLWGCRLSNKSLGHHPEGYGDSAVEAVRNAMVKPAMKKHLLAKEPA